MVGWVATGVDPVSSHEAPHPAAGVCFAGHEGLVSTSKIVGNEQSRPLLPGLSRGRLSYRGQMVCFLMFFVTCLSLGYQTLWRYDPRRHPALAEFSFCDPHSYYCMVQSDYSQALAPYRFRILGPGLASLIYRVLPPDRIGHADPVYFSLLMVNSIVMALACLAIMRLGQQTGQSLTAGCIGAFFYLASWCVANLTLGGVYIDSFEILILLALMIVVMASAWQWTPLLLAAAAMAKETTVIFGLSLMLAVIADAWLSRRKVPRRGWGGGCCPQSLELPCFMWCASSSAASSARTRLFPGNAWRECCTATGCSCLTLSISRSDHWPR